MLRDGFFPWDPSKVDNIRQSSSEAGSSELARRKCVWKYRIEMGRVSGVGRYSRRVSKIEKSWKK
jgi:hypothetical protein